MAITTKGVKRKTFNEDFAKFFENPSREGFRNLIRDGHGELTSLDFKESWPVHSKVAKHVLGFANMGGGCLVIGIAENPDKTFDVKGLGSLIDKANVTSGLKKYLPNNLLSSLDILDFSYEDSEYPKLKGKKFQVLFVDADPVHMPFVAAIDGDGIRGNAIYVRRGTATVEADYEELQRVLNARLETGYSTQGELDLKLHLEQLKILFSQIEQYKTYLTGGVFQSLMQAMAQNSGIQSMFGQSESRLNSKFPAEDFESFISRMIDKKKRRIEMELEVDTIR